MFSSFSTFQNQRESHRNTTMDETFKKGARIIIRFLIIAVAKSSRVAESRPRRLITHSLSLGVWVNNKGSRASDVGEIE